MVRDKDMNIIIINNSDKQQKNKIIKNVKYLLTNCKILTSWIIRLKEV